MSIESNKALVGQFCQYLSGRSLDKMFALMTEDATWSGVGKPEFFKYGGARTKAQSVQFIGDFLNSFAHFRFDVLSITAEDDRVAVEATSEGSSPDGAVYRNQYLVMFQCRNGQITSISEYFDQIAVLEYEKMLA